MSNHTPEPWIHLNGEHIIYSKLEDGCRGIHIARVNTIMPTDQANAGRIVQCVNDCAGMEKPAEEIQAMREELDKLRADKARLVEALRKLATSQEYASEEQEFAEQLLTEMKQR